MMKQHQVDQEIVQKVLQISGSDEIITERMGGLTNFVYKVTSGDRSIIYKIYSDYFSIFQDRGQEILIQSLLSSQNMAPKILYHNQFLRVEEYLPYSPLSAQELQSDALKVAEDLGRLHSVKYKDDENIIHIPSQQPWIKAHLTNRNLQEKVQRVLQEQLFTNLEQKQHLINLFDTIFKTQVQSKILDLFQNPTLLNQDLVLCHNDLNSTNFLRESSGKLHILDWEAAGPNYPGYDIANFLTELNWDYTYDKPPYFQVYKEDSMGSKDVDRFLTVYWQTFTNSDQKYPQWLVEQIQVCRTLQNYFWMFIGCLSLSFDKADLGLDLYEYITMRIRILESNLKISIFEAQV